MDYRNHPDVLNQRASSAEIKKWNMFLEEESTADPEPCEALEHSSEQSSNPIIQLGNAALYAISVDKEVSEQDS